MLQHTSMTAQSSSLDSSLEFTGAARISNVDPSDHVLPRVFGVAPELAVRRIEAIKIVVPERELASTSAFYCEVLGFHRQQADQQERGQDILLTIPQAATGVRLVPTSLPGDDPNLVQQPNRLGLRHFAMWVQGDLSVFVKKVACGLREVCQIEVPDEALGVKTYKDKRLVYLPGPQGVLLEFMQVGPREQGGAARVRAIDHVNIVSKDIPRSLEFFQLALGMRPVDGKVGRLRGSWIEEMTQLKGVDADYIALEIPGQRTKIELIQYFQPGVVADKQANNPSWPGIRSLELSSQRPEELYRYAHSRTNEPVQARGRKAAQQLCSVASPGGAILDFVPFDPLPHTRVA